MHPRRNRRECRLKSSSQHLDASFECTSGCLHVGVQERVSTRRHVLPPRCLARPQCRPAAFSTRQDPFLPPYPSASWRHTPQCDSDTLYLRAKLQEAGISAPPVGKVSRRLQVGQKRRRPPGRKSPQTKMPDDDGDGRGYRGGWSGRDGRGLAPAAAPAQAVGQSPGPAPPCELHLEAAGTSGASPSRHCR